MARTISHTCTILKIGQVIDKFTRFPTCMMLESGRIRLVRPPAVIITYFLLNVRQTLENFIHKDRRRNAGCVHYNY
jgi:hypothetical protein